MEAKSRYKHTKNLIKIQSVQIIINWTNNKQNDKILTAMDRTAMNGRKKIPKDNIKFQSKKEKEKAEDPVDCEIYEVEMGKMLKP